MVEELENKQKVVNIVPASKGKRILLFLADLFLNFILSFVVLNLIVVPLGKLFVGFKGKTNDYTENQTLRADILYQNGVVINSGDVEKKDLVYNVSFSYYCFLSYYSYNEENPSNMIDDQFGHKEENEVIRHYFIDIINNQDKYVSLFDNYNNDKYFVKDGINYSLREEYKAQIAPYFKQGDSVSENGEKYIKEIETSVFYPLYSEVMSLIEENDLIYNDLSYKEITKEIKEYEKFLRNFIVITSFTALAISSIALYLMVPIFNQNRKTLSMMIMKMERVTIDKLSIVKKYECIVSTIYAILTNMIIVFFIPLLQATIFELFNIPILFIFGLFSIVLMLGSLIFLLFNKFNRTLFDFFTRVVYLKTEQLDEIYRAKGYYI